MNFRSSIRDIPDFPKPGIIFKDITPLLQNASVFKQAVDALCVPFREASIDAVAGVEARGFIFGAAMAIELGAAFIPIRKPGKLPAAVEKETYSLEYGSDAIEIHRDAVQPGQKILLADDLLATGGTAEAAVRLIKRLGGEVAGAAFLISLDFLPGRKRLKDLPVHVLISYDTE